MNFESSRPAQRVSQRRTSRRVRGRDDFLDVRCALTSDWLLAVVIVSRKLHTTHPPGISSLSLPASLLHHAGRKAVLILYDDNVEKERVDIFSLKSQHDMHDMMTEKTRLMQSECTGCDTHGSLTHSFFRLTMHDGSGVHTQIWNEIGRRTARQG